MSTELSPSDQARVERLSTHYFGAATIVALVSAFVVGLVFVAKHEVSSRPAEPAPAAQVGEAAPPPQVLEWNWCGNCNYRRAWVTGGWLVMPANEKPVPLFVPDPEAKWSDAR